MPRDYNVELADAVLAGNVARASAILADHPELCAAILRHPQTTDDTPAIILASSCGAGEIVERLIDMGVSTETEYDKEGWRPLHIAAQRDHVRVGEILLRAGAAVDAADKRSAKPIQWALKHRHFEFAGLLLRYGADIDIRWRDGYAFINHEAKDGKNETLKFMLQHGADPNARDHRFGAGTTALHCAARHDRLQAAEILLEFGAKVNAETDDGLTPLDMAKMSKRQKVAALLRSRGGKFGLEGGPPVHPCWGMVKYEPS